MLERTPENETEKTIEYMLAARSARSNARKTFKTYARKNVKRYAR